MTPVGLRGHRVGRRSWTQDTGRSLVMAWPHPLAGSWGPHSFFLVFFLTPRGHDDLLQVGLVFAPRGERHVHSNHAIKAVHLVEVNG
jgi:hypothetical protein